MRLPNPRAREGATKLLKVRPSAVASVARHEHWGLSCLRERLQW